MPRSKSLPLTPAQQDQIYYLYTQVLPKPTMSFLATTYGVSISVIHRTLHAQAFSRGLQLATPNSSA